MKAYLEKQEANPEETKSVAEHQDVPKEETAVKTWSTEGAVWGPASSLRVPPAAEKLDPG
jgi:hypothetical protein